jgi:tripartite-type tricarboxylate transporter receptor subunit TctC
MEAGMTTHPLLPRRAALLAAAAAAPLARPAALRAQPPGAWPARPVCVIVPFTPGGATDAVGRITAERLSAAFGQPFPVENRAGAGGLVGAEAAARAEADGHTLLVATISVSAIAPHLGQRLSFGPVRDIVPVAGTAHVANGVLVRPDLPARSLAELLDLMRARPGQLTYGTPGNGTSGHLCGEYLKYRAGVDMTHVPYRGTAPLVTDLIGGRLDLCVDNLPIYLPHVRDGRLRLLAVTSAERWFAAPEVPTVAEAAPLPGFAAMPWWGVQAPKGTPEPILDRLAEATVAAMRDPAVQARLRELGIEAAPLGRAEFDRHIAAEHAKWGEVVRAAGIRAD